MDVATYCHRGIHMLYVRLLDQDFPGLQAEISYLLFRDLLAVLEKLDLAERWKGVGKCQPSRERLRSHELDVCSLIKIRGH